MNDLLSGECRYFLTYSGVTLPLKLVEPLADIGHRNTYYRGYFDGDNRLIGCQKVVYGEWKASIATPITRAARWSGPKLPMPMAR